MKVNLIATINAMRKGNFLFLSLLLLAGASWAVANSHAHPAPEIIRDASGMVRVHPAPIAPEFRNPWSPQMEQEFWERANVALRYYVGRNYGNTHGENEKRSYALAMYDLVGGDRSKALAFLQSPDVQEADHAHTEGIDYYYAFTLRGQIRKYFLFGEWLSPAYRQGMFRGAQQWTARDPNGRPHPLYGLGDGSGVDWDSRRRGGWVDSRNTDGLRAMREVAVYLMAEETGNESVRQLYYQKLQAYVGSLYQIGMGEWDSENYHGHTLTAYLNLYDFAQDPAVKRLGKAALDWFMAAGAVKYYRGGFGGPTKRDYGMGNTVFRSSAASLLWLYFGDTPQPNPWPDRESIYAITSGYRPPQAVVALARKQFLKPVELWSAKPTYENWKPGGRNHPAYWETTFFGHTYQMGSVVAAFPDGDVGPFKLMATNRQRGMDYFVVNTGDRSKLMGKQPGDQIGQFQNLLLWVRPAGIPFRFQWPRSAPLEIENGIWFLRLEQTWLAIRPIHLETNPSPVSPDKEWADRYSEERQFQVASTGKTYAGFALEVGEPQSHGTYARFKQQVKAHNQVDLSGLQQGRVELRGSQGRRLKLIHNSQSELPIVFRDGVWHDWKQHQALYRAIGRSQPISLGWKQGTLQIQTGGQTFHQTYRPSNFTSPIPPMYSPSTAPASKH